MSLYETTMEERFHVLDDDGTVIAADEQSALELVTELGYRVENTTEGFQVYNEFGDEDQLIADDLNSLLELIEESGYTIKWPSDESLEEDEDITIKDYCRSLGIKY